MSVEQNGDQISLACDAKGCSEETREYHRGEFHELVHHAKLQGWRVRNEGRSGWSHTCPDCVAEEELAEFS